MNSSNKKQQFNKNKEEDKMNWVTSKALLKRAKNQAKICLENGESTRSVKFGAIENMIFVSSDPEKVVATESFSLEGTEFFLGTKKD